MKQSGNAYLAYQTIRSAILRGDLAPGESLSENQLAEQFGISRTPIREALQTLAREGFLEVVPARGWFVTRLSVYDLQELFHLREALEGMAARLAAQRATEEDIAELERSVDEAEQFQPGEWEKFALAGTEYHRKIIAVAGSKRLGQFMDALSAQIVLMRASVAQAVADRREEVRAEHLAVVSAIKHRDPDMAERRARAHVRSSYEALLQRLR